MMYKRYEIVAYPGINGFFCRYWPVENDSAQSGQTTIEHQDRHAAIQAAKADIDQVACSEASQGQGQGGPVIDP